MPARWVICPVVTEIVPGWGTLRYPKVDRMADPGLPPKPERPEGRVESP